LKLPPPAIGDCAAAGEASAAKTATASGVESFPPPESRALIAVPVTRTDSSSGYGPLWPWAGSASTRRKKRPSGGLRSSPSPTSACVIAVRTASEFEAMSESS
jgi:hypothetical protein